MFQASLQLASHSRPEELWDVIRTAGPTALLDLRGCESMDTFQSILGSLLGMVRPDKQMRTLFIRGKSNILSNTVGDVYFSYYSYYFFQKTKNQVIKQNKSRPYMLTYIAVGILLYFHLSVCPSARLFIHPFPFFILLILCRSQGKLAPIPADFEQNAGYTKDRLPIYRMTSTEIYSHSHSCSHLWAI